MARRITLGVRQTGRIVFTLDNAYRVVYPRGLPESALVRDTQPPPVMRWGADAASSVREDVLNFLPRRWARFGFSSSRNAGGYRERIVDPFHSKGDMSAKRVNSSVW